MRRLAHLLLLLIVLLTVLAPQSTTTVQAQEGSPWGEVFDENGNVRSDVVDLGVTTEYPDWMSVDLPFGQRLDLQADYHRFQTANGDIVVLPSATTLFFMAMHPQESGLAGSAGMMSNGLGSVITFLGLVAGDSIDWNRLQSAHPEYKEPSDFWNAVLSGKENAWTWFSGWGFITNLLSMSWNDAAMRSAFLLYLKGAANCAQIPGGCSGVVIPPPPTRVTCPDSSIAIAQPALSIQKITPNNPLVVGQDPEERRGADVQIAVTVPPVIFTWYEPIYEEEDICREPGAGETPNCKQSSASTFYDGVSDTELVFKECLQHVEQLPDTIRTVQATATLSGDSQAWIKSQLGQTHYGAYVRKPSFALIPGLGTYSASCDGGGTCRANGIVQRIPFADPGTFNLKLQVTTSGTQFMGMPITQPRNLSADGKLQVYVTLPALIP